MRPRALRTNHCADFGTEARDDHITLTRAITLRAHTAESPEEVEAAKHLIRRRYAWRGYDMPGDEEESVREVFEPHPSQVVLVAKDRDMTVGTITLGLDGQSGLLAERTYPEPINDHRVAGCNVCDVTRLAVAEQADSKRVLAALFSLAFTTGSVHGVTHTFVEVNPRHVVFYRRLLGFVVAAEEKFCERVKAPSVLLCVEKEKLEQYLIKLNARFAGVSLEAQAA